MQRDLAAACIWLVFIGIAHAQNAASPNPYPNELPNLKLYTKYLSPLRPYASDEADVVRMFGSMRPKVVVDGWSIWPLILGKGATLNGRLWARDISGHLAHITLEPNRRISMHRVKFPPAFSHSIGSVSEINVVCDVYKDANGLEYWVHAQHSTVGRAGDLWRIVYGPSAQLEREVVGEQ